METMQLDKDTSLELMDGEVVIFAHKVGRSKGFMGTNWLNFAITNKRIALVPYPQKGKAAEPVETINYASLYKAKSKFESDSGDQGQFILVLNEKTKKLGFIPVRKSLRFGLRGSLKEIVTLNGTMFAAGLKTQLIELGKAADRQARRQAIEARGDLTYEQKQWAMSDEWQKVEDSWAGLYEKTAIYHKKPTPVDRQRLIIDLVNEAIVMYGK